jgi:oxygen-independent coproporphyrinogen-3 oxidase
VTATGCDALYVHVPFCARRCTYCDFDFVVGRRPNVEAWLAGLAAELDARGDELAAPLRTIYFGGGTPSLLGPLGLVAAHALLIPWIGRDGPAEFTVELNPEHVDDALLAALAAIGADRVSLGVQSFEAAALRQLGRAHDPARALAAARACLAAGLSTSVDLIVGWPGQDTAALDRDLDRVLELGVPHVSVYALTIESGTSWPKLVRRGLRVLPDDEGQAEALERTHARLVTAGFDHYEIASYARPGHAALHNGVYWSWRDYVGVGPSAASARYAEAGAVTRRTNPRGLDAWLAGAPPEFEALGAVEAAAEGLWLALRTGTGVDLPAFLARFPAVDAAWVRGRAARRVARGDLRWTGDRLATAPGRWMVLDGIAAELLGDPEPGAR